MNKIICTCTLHTFHASDVQSALREVADFCEENTPTSPQALTNVELQYDEENDRWSATIQSDWKAKA